MSTATIADSVLGQYGLAEDPFSLSPDPRFLYLTNQHKAALAKLRYVMERRQGFAVLYGDIGHGKSTLIRRLFGIYRGQDAYESVLIDRKSTRLNSSHANISYAVFC